MEGALHEFIGQYDCIIYFLPFSETVEPEGNREEVVLLLQQHSALAGHACFIPVCLVVSQSQSLHSSAL